MSLIPHSTLFCMVLIVVLCCISPVSAMTIADTSSTMTVTGLKGTACIPEIINIQGTTNYNTDNRVIVEISPAEFGITNKDASDSFSGTIATVAVQRGTGINSWKMSANTAG